ncbi:flippase [Flavobacterium sp.]|uniref:flippase n=1 Tax=Flavobacterium sp. TaxID=239 RepID=UPI001B5838B0|nr:flippase [Flavobacterium sp.]MBP6183009.1 flippase [Flavobacterium sp.]
MTAIKKLYSQVHHLFFNKGGYTLLYRMLGMGMSFLSITYISNQFGGDDFGLFSLSLTLLQIATMFFSLGLPSAFIAFTGGFSSREENKGLLIKAYKIILITAILPLTLLYFQSEYVAGLFQKPHLDFYIKTVAIGLFIQVLFELNINYFLSIHRQDLYSIFYFLLPNTLFIGILFLFKKFNLPDNYCMVAYVLTYLIVLIGSSAFVFLQGKISKVTVSTRAFLNKSVPMMMSGFFLILLNWTDILILGKLETEENIGIYNAAFKVGYLALFFVTMMNSFVVPKISEYHHQNDYLNMKTFVNKATRMVIVLTLPVAIVIILFSPYLLSYFGTGFEAGALSLQLITLGALFNAMTGNVDQILNMTNHQKLVRNIMFVGFLVNIVGNLLLIPRFGYLGAAISSLVVNVIVNSIFVLVIKKKLGFYTFI